MLLSLTIANFWSIFFFRSKWLRFEQRTSECWPIQNQLRFVGASSSQLTAADLSPGN